MIFETLLRKISKIMCQSKDSLARSAELYIERPVIFAISLREIAKMTGLSKGYSVAVGGKRLFTQPRESEPMLELITSIPA
jgi:hypothetical protein